MKMKSSKTKKTERHKKSISKINSTTKENLKEYASNSTIHGLRYLSERERPIIEKIWWIIVFVISIALCAIFIKKIFIKWRDDPVIVSFADRATPIFDIPFPAVTICPNYKTERKIFNFSRVFDKLNPSLREYLGYSSHEDYNATEEDIAHIESVMHVCQNSYILQMDNESLYSNFSNEAQVEYLYNVSPRMSKVLIHVEFDGIMYHATWNDTFEQNKDMYRSGNIFTELLTEEGICYNFNLLKSSNIFKKNAVQYDYEFISNREQKSFNWNLDVGYKNFHSELYPIRANRTGDDAGLIVYLVTDIEDCDYRCQFLSMPGYKVIIHSPADFPGYPKQTFTAHLNKELNVKVAPRKGSISEGLKSYSPERRNCYLINERQLYYFQSYTKMNCELECLSNFTLKLCDCVNFSMPRTNTTRICGAKKIKCYTEAIKTFETMLFKGGMSDKVLAECNCLSGCNYLKYDYTYVETDYDFTQFFNVSAEFNDSSGVHFTLVKIFFQDQELIASIRSERYGLVDFISNCGGLLGLFMGVSILSFIEIIFYFTIRLICNYLKKINEQRLISARIDEDVIDQIERF